jgi:FAD binding domain
MITCSPPRFALQPSRVIDASSRLVFRAAGIQPSLLAVLGVALLYAGEPELANPQTSAGTCWRVRAVEIVDIAPWQPAQLVAEHFQQGRVLLVGDAAHTMPPKLGLGANTAIQSAQNLAWKLAAVFNGAAAPQLLATYQTERHPVGRLASEHRPDATTLAHISQGQPRHLWISPRYHGRADHPAHGLRLDLLLTCQRLAAARRAAGAGLTHARERLRAFSLDNVTAGQQARRDGAVLWRCDGSPGLTDHPSPPHGDHHSAPEGSITGGSRANLTAVAAATGAPRLAVHRRGQ